MKPLLFMFLLLPVLSFSQVQMPLKDGKVFYEFIDSVPNNSRAKLFTKSKAWLVNTFNSGKAVLQMDDKEEGIVMGKGFTSLDLGNFITGSVQSNIHYTINITVKDDKYRIQIYDISVRSESGSYTPEYCLKYPKMNKKKLERIDKNIKDLLSLYVKAISKPEVDF